MGEYIKIEITIGLKLEQVVNLLLKNNAEGIKTYCEFNGVKLYSDTVEMESAYKEVVGMTKTEFDECRRIIQANYTFKKP